MLSNMIIRFEDCKSRGDLMQLVAYWKRDSRYHQGCFDFIVDGKCIHIKDVTTPLKTGGNS